MPLSPVKEDTDVRVGHDLISVIEDPEDVEARPGKRPSVSDDHAVQPATLEGAVRRLTLEDHVALVPKQNLGFDELRAKWKESEPTFDRLFAYIRKKVLSSRGPYGVADTFTIDMLPEAGSASASMIIDPFSDTPSWKSNNGMLL